MIERLSPAEAGQKTDLDRLFARVSLEKAEYLKTVELGGSKTKGEIYHLHLSGGGLVSVMQVGEPLSSAKKIVLMAPGMDIASVLGEEGRVSTYFGGVAAKLAERGCSVGILLNWPGYAKGNLATECNWRNLGVKPYSLDEKALVLGGLVKWVVDRNKAAPITLVAHSMAAAAASLGAENLIGLALKNQLSLVLDGPPGLRVASRSTLKYMEAVVSGREGCLIKLQSAYPALGTFLTGSYYGLPPIQAMSPAFRRLMGKVPPEVIKAEMVALLRAEKVSVDGLSSLPVKIIVGENDRTVLGAGEIEEATGIKPVVMEDMGHLGAIQDPERYAQVISELAEGTGFEPV